MGKNALETLLGAVVLLVAVIFIYISYKSGNIGASPTGYVVKAKFHEIGNVSVGSDVRVGGIKVGTIISQYLDPKTYKAVLEVSIKKEVRLPKDSSATIASEGLLGGKYLSIEPGSDENILKTGDEILYTQDAVNLEHLIGKFAFGGTKEEETESTAPADKKDLIPSLNPDL